MSFVADIGRNALWKSMERSKPLEEQVRDNLAAVDALAAFTDERIWLTFYLSGDPGKLKAVSDVLSHDGWRNTEGWEYAFIYPKYEVERTVPAIVAVADKLRDLCDPKGVKIINIDADTLSDVANSKFVTLYSSPG